MCYTNMKIYFKPPHHEPGIGLSKHQVVICTSCTSGVLPPQQVCVTKQCQTPREHAALCRTVQAIDWTPLYSLPTCHDQFFMFDAVLSSLIDEHLLIKTLKRNTNDQPWVTDEIHKSGRAEAVSLSLWRQHNGIQLLQK